MLVSGAEIKKVGFSALCKNGRELDTGQYDKEIELDMTDDMSWLLPRQVFERVGYYSTNFFYMANKTIMC